MPTFPLRASVWLFALAAPALAQTPAPAVQLQLALSACEAPTDLSVSLSVEIENLSASLLAGISIDVDVLDASGSSALGAFTLSTPQLVGISSVDGSPIHANLAPGATATATFALTPLAAAVLGGSPAEYALTGSLSATFEGSALTRSFPLEELRVLAAPRLELELYWPELAHGVWSTTAGIFEEEEPFSLGCVVRNTGSGVASGLCLISKGPSFLPDPLGAPLASKVLELEIDGAVTAGGFALFESQLGDLAPGEEHRILWTAGANHEAMLFGFPVSLLVDDVLVMPASSTSEPLVHAALAFESVGDGLDDGRVDWLVDEPSVPAPIDTVTGASFTEFPSVFRSSEGSDLPLIAHTSPAMGAPPSPTNLMSAATITVAGPGWHYLHFDDPGGFLYELAGVTRTQKALHLGGLDVGGPGDVSRVWTTARPLDLTGDGIPDLVRRTVHIADFVPAAGVWEYGLSYLASGSASLSADTELLFAQTGGVQHLTLDAGPAHAGELFFLLGSLSGTQPGTPVGVTTLPLNVDGYLLQLLTNAAIQGLFHSIGVLDGQGRGSAQIVMPAGLAVGPGLAAHHAFFTVPISAPISFASNAVVLFVLP